MQIRRIKKLFLAFNFLKRRFKKRKQSFVICFLCYNFVLKFLTTYTSMKKKHILLFALLILFFASCRKANIIESFVPIVEHQGEDTVLYNIDLTNGVFEGLSMPANDSVFHFEAKIQNNENKKLYYKIYYQNISYAFENEHPLSYENFYGSWENTSTTFKECTSDIIKDNFRIVGNPRNERKYFGIEFPDRITEQDVEKILKKIKLNPEWYNSIKKKAEENKVSLDVQMYKDALWDIKNYRNSVDETNRRERRNPRTGVYEFMLVVCDSNALSQIPNYIKDISLTNDSNNFVNPFDYFLNKEGKKIEGVYTLIAKQKLKTKAKFNLGSGVFVNREVYPYNKFDVFEGNDNVGDNDSLYKYAQFEQYFHNINLERFINQIEQLSDVVGGEFSLQNYKDNVKDSNFLQRKKIHPCITMQPGKTIKANKDFIELINPGNSSLENAKKESTGIRSRIGFTYGKFRAKVKFPPILNKHGVWNGLTNAFWLIFQSENEWNNRRFSKTGYVKENYNVNETERVSNTHYSEIDIEMVKTSKYWYKKEHDKDKSYNPYTDNKFIFAATNWDLACNDNGFIPNHLHFSKKYDGRSFIFHRWNGTHRALTSRFEVSNDIFLQPFYYFEIEWTPKEIIWRIGPDENNMQVVGYMNEEFTTIPNNQMLPIFTQEFHYSEFWPPIIFEQGLIPYPSKDIIGRIYELTIE